MTTSPKHRSLGQQLNRSPRVMHASWLLGVTVILSSSTAGGFSVQGVIFLVVLFLPIYVAYRRDRLNFRIIFATFFLPTWPWAVYLAFRRKPHLAPTPA